jgi:hypothetical protein
LFQNSVGFGHALGKTGQKPGFSAKFKKAVPKTEVLEQPPSKKSMRAAVVPPEFPSRARKTTRINLPDRVYFEAWDGE